MTHKGDDYGEKIKFNLFVDGKSIGDFEQLQDNFSADLLDYIENQKLAKWFSVRDMDEKAQGIANIDPNSSPTEQMKVLCRIMELEDDDDVITYLLEEKETREKEQTIRQEQDLSTKISVEESEESNDTDNSEGNHNGEDWSGWDLSERDFEGADLRGYNLSRVNFNGANLSGANLSGCDLSNALLIYADLSGANLSRCDLSKADLTGAELTNADFTYCNLCEALIKDVR
jgi:Uncharacterized low-complexity proteins